MQATDCRLVITNPFLPAASFGLRALMLPVRVCVYVCVRVFVNQEFVRAISRQLFKLGSPHLDKKMLKTLVKSPIVLWDY